MPTFSSKERFRFTGSAEPPEFQLEVTVRENGIEVGDRATGLLNRIDKTGDDYHLDQLTTYLTQVKDQFPSKTDATLLLEPDISYDVLVAVMDRVRVTERVAAGDTVFTPGLAGLVLGEFRRMAEGPQDPVDQLTDRETEVLKMVAKGMSYKQIAQRLVLSHRTVQNHVQNTLRKLQMNNLVQLTRWAIEHGLDDDQQ